MTPRRSTRRKSRIATLGTAVLLALTFGGCGPSQVDRHDAGSVAFRISKTHGLLNFVQAIAGHAHRSPILVEAFKASSFDTEDTARSLEKFKQARRDLTLSVTFDGYPLERRMGRNLLHLFAIQSVYARDLNDLSERTMGMLPLADHRRLFESLEALEPVYDAVIWNEHRAELERYRERLEQAATKWGIEKLFSAAEAAYGAEWPEGTPFTFALYPLPGSRGTTSAESIGSVESVGVLLGEQDLADRFGVLFHEMCHSLYEAQPAALQQELERAFTSSSSPYARLAYQQFNEAMATALGNGWAYARATGHENEGSWYNDPVVDGYAKALYPTVASYLDPMRRIDDAFVRKAIDVFAATFPDAIYKYPLLLDRIVLMTDGQGVRGQEVADELRRHFRVSSVASSSPIDHERSLATIAQTGETLVVVVTEPQVQQLSALASAYPPIAASLTALRRDRGDALSAGVDEHGRAWIVIKLHDRASLGRAVDLMYARDKIDPANPIERLGRGE